MKQTKFKKGFVFRRFEGTPETDIVRMEDIDEVFIPLHQGFGAEVKPLVKIGDKVKRGEIIGRNDDTISTPVHASISGTVTEIAYIHENNHIVNAIKIKGDGSSDFAKLDGSKPDWKKLKSKELQRLLYEGGVTGLDNGGIPTIFNSSVVGPRDVEHLIINGVNGDIFNIDNEVILHDDNLMKVQEALMMLKEIMPKAQTTFVLNEGEKKLGNKLNECNVRIVQPKYPMNFDEVIVPVVTGKKFPHGYLAANIGVIVLTPQTLLHVYEAVVEGKAVVERIVALGGKPWKKNCNLITPIGTSVGEIVKQFIGDVDSRVLINSLLTGLSVEHHTHSIDRGTVCLIAVKENDERGKMVFTKPGSNFHSYSKSFTASLNKKTEMACDTNIKGEHRPCINCGYCQDVCPVNLLPFILQRHVEYNVINEKLVRYGIFDCIGCNLCSYVCPSKIDLSGIIREGEEKLLEEDYARDEYIPQKFDLKGLEDFRKLKGIQQK